MKKLVRDLIPDIIKRQGKTPVCLTATKSEYKTRLIAKLQEEVTEFKKDETIEEVADILEVLHALCRLKDYSLEEVELVKQKKLLERGGFEKRIILQEIQTLKDSK